MSNTSQKITVFGVDPAPSKGLCVCSCVYEEGNVSEQQFQQHNDCQQSISGFITSVKNAKKVGTVLIIWDAPLTYPNYKGYYGRCVEKRWEVYAKKIKKKCEINLSVREAAGCPHWAITQRVLGFPSLNKSPLPDCLLGNQIQLITTESDKEKIYREGIFVVETHPALAIAIQYKGNPIAEKKWYRDSAGAAEKYLMDIDRIWEFEKVIERFPSPLLGLEKNDYIDAMISMILGVKWLQGSDVKIDGNLERGSFLLPFNEFEREKAIQWSELEKNPPNHDRIYQS